MLFHVSEDPGIVEFIPRPSKYTQDPVVWAVDDEKIRNYLVPRDCPRVTYYADAQTVPEDSARFLGSSGSVVAIEASWWNRIRSFTLYCYHLPSDTFESIDECGGYFVSRASVRPLHVEIIEDPFAALLARGAELRILPTLGPLPDSIIASTLQFSIIRMHNADATHTATNGHGWTGPSGRPRRSLLPRHPPQLGVYQLNQSIECSGGSLAVRDQHFRHRLATRHVAPPLGSTFCWFSVAIGPAASGLRTHLRIP